MGIDEGIALAVSAEMARQRVSVAWLSANSGIPDRTLRRTLNAEQNVKLAHVWRIAQALSLPCSELVARAERLASD